MSTFSKKWLKMHSNAEYENIYNYLNNFQRQCSCILPPFEQKQDLIFYNLYQQGCFWDKKPKKVYMWFSKGKPLHEQFSWQFEQEEPWTLQMNSLELWLELK